MNIILKEHIDFYRLTVAKIIFLLTENEKYSYIEDIGNSSLMIVEDKIIKTKVCVSILRKPQGLPWCVKSEQLPIYVFYEEREYNKNKIHEYKICLLKHRFSEKFSKEIEYAFFDVDKFFENIPSEYMEMFNKYFKQAKLKIPYFDYSNLYKYYSKNKVAKNKHNINNGHLHFSHPKYFNDPFDCNCTLANNQSISDNFRILCMTPMYDNILMWSYYADSHKGYCFEFKMSELIDKIMESEVGGLCIYGEVKYNHNRPPYKSQVNHFSFSNLNFYINSIFTKYKEWEHERETRFVIISQNFASDFIDLQLCIKNIYGGCNSINNIIKSTYGNINVNKLYKDNTQYKLI